MAINQTGGSEFGRMFGARSNAQASASPQEDRPNAQVWANIGYQIETEEVDGNGETVTKTVFIGTPFGLPIDTMKPREFKGSNVDGDFAEIVSNSNKLLSDLQELGASLNPGETRLVNLQVEIRRVAVKRELPEASKESKFARGFELC